MKIISFTLVILIASMFLGCGSSSSSDSGSSGSASGVKSKFLEDYRPPKTN